MYYNSGGLAYSSVYLQALQDGIRGGLFKIFKTDGIATPITNLNQGSSYNFTTPTNNFRTIVDTQRATPLYLDLLDEEIKPSGDFEIPLYEPYSRKSSPYKLPRFLFYLVGSNYDHTASYFK